jgi:O-succinylbenzoic acid--CoA ligase
MRVDLLARRLATAGVAAGGRVATVLDPSLRAVELVHAVQRLGAVLVPLNPRLSAGEIRGLLDFATPTLTVTPSTRRSEIPGATASEELDAVDPAPLAVLRDMLRAQEAATIIFTSGTSGVPKGVVLTHASHAASATASAARLGTTRDDRWLVCMPLCHVGGLGVLYRSVRTGFTVVLHEGFDAAAVVRTLADEGITMISLVPTMLARLLDALGAARVPATLRCALIGGGPLPAPVLERALAAGMAVVQTYGLTEAASHVTTDVPGTPCEAGVVGTPLPGIEVDVVDPDPEGIGEIRVRGPVVMDRYLDQAGLTERTLHEGWLHTGDVGRFEGDGCLRLVGRRSDLVVTGGENVHPTEVEAVLLGHPGVAEAAVYAAPDDEWGERIEAKIVASPDGIDLAALGSWCAAQLAGFKVPKAFHVVPELPRTASGKLRRDRLG